MKNNINLLPPRPKIRQSLGPLALALIIISVTIVACLAGFYSFRRQTIINTELRTKEIKDTIALIKTDVDALAKVEARTLEIGKLLDEVVALEEPHLSPAMVLAELKSKVPSDVWLTSAGVTGTEAVTIKGVTYSYQSVARALFSLESSGALKDMKVGTVSRTEDIESDAVYDDFVIVGNLERRR